MTRRALVTGATGFVGRWLVPALIEDGFEVFACGRAPLRGREARGARWLSGDLRSPGHAREVVRKSRPHVVVHLAGISFLPEALRRIEATIALNVGVAARLLHELNLLRESGDIDPRVLIVGSGEQYGRHPRASMPLRETAPLRPLTIYGASKTAQESVSLAAWRATGLHVMVARSFNHSGAGQARRFLIPALVSRVLRIRAGLETVLRIGNGTTVRDFLHVADVVEAYRLLVERGRAGESYNVSSGRGSTVAEVAEIVLERLRIDARVEPAESLRRKVEVPWLVGDSRKLKRDTGWKPRRTLADVVDDLAAAEQSVE